MLDEIFQIIGRYQNYLRQRWETWRERQPFRYLRGEVLLDKLIPAFLTLGVFGYIPYFYLTALLVAVPYGIIKRHALMNAFNTLIDDSPHNPHSFKARLRHFASTRLRDVNRWLYHIIPIYLFLTFPLGTAFLGMYGYYRMDKARWFGYLSRFANAVYTPINRLGGRLVGGRRARIRQALALGGLGLSMALLYMVGFLSFFPVLLHTVLGGILLVTPIIGMGVFLKDVFYAIRHPLQTGTTYTGLFLGILSGRATAYALYYGRLQGHMGHVIGHVTSTSFLTMLASTFSTTLAGPFEGRFFWSSGANIFSTFVNAFSVQHVVMGADFFGVAGPTNQALFYYTLMGALAGWLVHKGVTAFYNQGKQDANNVYHFVISNENGSPRQRVGDFLYPYRWSIAGVTTGMLLTLASPLTPFFLSYLGGSALVGGPIVFAGLIVSAVIGHKVIPPIVTRLERAYERWVQFRAGDPANEANAHAAAIGQSVRAEKEGAPNEDALDNTLAEDALSESRPMTPARDAGIHHGDDAVVSDEELDGDQQPTPPGSPRPQ